MTLPKAAVPALACLVACLAGAGQSAAGWPPEGRLLCTSCRASGARIASDEAGGAFISWLDRRNSPDGTNDDLYLQRILPSGDLAPGWPADGFPVCTDPSQLSFPEQPVVADGSDGVFLAWSDFRNLATGSTSVDIYVQRILADGGIAPGWVVNGVPASRAAGYQNASAVVPDGEGGVYVTWDNFNTPDIYLQHLSANGQVAPGWPADGLPVCVLPGKQGAPRLASDGGGGAFIVWVDDTRGTDLFDTFVQRVTSGGQLAPGWPENGRLMAAGRAMLEIMPDGTNGAYLSLATPTGFAHDDYTLLRFTADGALSPGWPEGGVPVCLAPDERQGLRMKPDGAGGVLLTWSDQRDFFDDDIFALRIRGDGSRHPGWPVDGLRVTDNTPFDTFPDLAADGMGGAYLCWERSDAERRVLVQHLAGSGSLYPGWPANGSPIPTVIEPGFPRILADGVGGAIVSWEDVSQHVRALRIQPDGITAVQLSQLRAESEPGLVRLAWLVADPASFVGAVERRSASTEWEHLADLDPDGTGLLEYEDRAVTAGERYGYRLAYRDGAELVYSPEIWIDVPSSAVFALNGPHPNPTRDDLRVAFSLPSGEPARLELYDLSGRRVMAREVGSLGTGAHLFDLSQGVRLAAGVYHLRLTQGSRSATQRAVVVR